jgi:hypothetical protein
MRIGRRLPGAGAVWKNETGQGDLVIRDRNRIVHHEDQIPRVGPIPDAAVSQCVSAPAKEDLRVGPLLEIGAARRRQRQVHDELRHHDQVAGWKGSVPDAHGEEVVTVVEDGNSRVGDVLQRPVVRRETVARLVQGSRGDPLRLRIPRHLR